VGGATFAVADGGTIGSSTDADAMTISSAGVVTFSQTSVFSSGITVTGDITATGAIEPAGDTAAGDNAAIGYASADGLILTGQGSTSDVTFKNDAATTVFTIPTGTDDILFPDSAKAMWGASSDLSISHGGTNTSITNITGQLRIGGNDIRIQTQNHSEDYILCVDGGAVTLHYNDTAALATASGGGTLTGTWEVTTALVPDASDGAALGTTSLEWSDLYLADGAVLGFGDDQDVTLTHVADTGILLNSTMAIQFNDASQYINAPSATVLDINATDEVEVNATLMDVNANLDVSGTGVIAGAITGAAITASGILKTDDTTAATSTTDGSLQTDGGLSVAADAVIGDDLFMLSDAAVVTFGVNKDVTLTHVHDTGLLLNSTMQLQFNDASQYINAPSATVLDINATDEVEVNATLMDVNANLDVSGTAVIAGAITGAAITASGILKTDDNTAATSTTDGSLQTDGGLSVALDAVIGDDIIMISDAAVIHFGVNADVSLTHVHDTGLLLNSTMALQFNDASQYINAPSATVLDINATDEIELNATLADINANLDVSGTYTGGGLMTTGGNIVIPDDGSIGSATDTNAITISSAGIIAVTSTTASSSKTTGALTVVGGISTQADIYVGDFLQVEGDLWLKGDNKELRFYEGANYIGFEAPALSANQIWVLPDADSDDGDVLMTDGSGNLSFSTAVSGVAANFTVSANNSTNETVYPIFTDGATGTQGAESDTALTYNPSSGLLSTAAITLTGALTVGGTTTLNGNLVLGDAATDTLTIGATLQGASPLIFEGASANGNETTFAITDPTGDRTITFPDTTGTVVTTGDTATVTATMLAANSVDSSELVNGSVDAAHMSANSIDSDSYVDGSIDNAHLAANSVDSDNYVDDSIDTAHYAAGSVDATALGADCVTAAKIGDNVLNSEHYAADSIDEEHLANDCVGSAELKTLSTLLIKNSSGSTLKTLYGAGA
jgi:hypothetical protein